MIPGWLVEDSISETAEAVLKLFQFGVVGLSISNSILSLLSVSFLTIPVVRNEMAGRSGSLSARPGRRALSANLCPEFTLLTTKNMGSRISFVPLPF